MNMRSKHISTPYSYKITFQLLIFYIAVSILSCGPGMIGSGPPRPQDGCFMGRFSDGEVSMVVNHGVGSVTMSGWKERGYDAPWWNLTFIGRIQSTGVALGEFAIYFPAELDSSSEIVINLITIPDITINLSEGTTCETRNTISLSVNYNLPDGTPRTDLHREKHKEILAE